ncbi:3-isopropylmalate dehydratase large subunit [Mycolicibacterium smegmatis]|uniref:3-isopropylmalate dehydratase large subunit n=1 Tax=Mycolicibacterium smegmatis (strain MKD8) TaxID=1214915 RepID=A0A2U9PHI4_MYCSE|nr:aconitase/3-isopropylmalate dehydratase large subunit family protein [Mycolicibacterium smegmatis]AWT51201.1 3-isopropylmalate dehydratase large subunit [Mycolicibacterium smegmatis MKD8]
MSRPQTIIEKVLARAAHRDATEPGEIVACDVDMTVVIDIQFASLPLGAVRAVHDPDRVAIVMDHAVPAPTVRDAEHGKRARTFAKKHGITRFFDVGRHGIVHQVIAEQGLALPGTLLACTDSHTCAAGAFNAAARGLGPAEILQMLCTGRTWHRVPPTIRYELTGTKRPDVNGKDIFLAIADRWGDATDHALEFGGPGLDSIPMSDRRTIATQGAEVGADFAIFPADEVCLAAVRAAAPDAGFQPQNPDPDAVYADIRVVDLDTMEPMVARPGTVINNAQPVSELTDVRIDQAFIGSCANGQLADLATAAAILDGQHVAEGVRLIVTPASQQVYVDAVRLGYVETLVEAGAVVTNSTCGACFGYHMGLLAPGEVCITASTRNFRGRMGSTEASIYMASPATVAASAIAGHITSVPSKAGAGA